MIKKWEGLRLKAYLCPAGVPTIGYGWTHGVKLGDVITREEAERLLHLELEEKVYPAIKKYVKKQLTQNQFDAICSFVYNVGVGAFTRSTILRKINLGLIDEASDEFGRWIWAKGKKQPGLISRREEEKELFLTDAGQIAQSISPRKFKSIEYSR